VRHPVNVPEYDPTLFVNREPEITLVLDKATTIAAGEPVRERTIVFWGYKGTGRTWLLRHLTGLLEEMPGIKPAYIDLDLFAGQPIEKAVRNLFAQAVGNIWGPDSEQAALYGRTVDVPFSTVASWLTSDIAELLQKQALVLLLDHVYEADWRLLEELEKRFLVYWAIHPRVLLVMAGRGQAYPWSTPELRLWTQDCLLRPFDQNLTMKQLEKLKPDAVPRAAEIHEVSRGYPLGNYLLAARPTISEAMQQAVDGLLEGVPKEERAWLEALCVLRGFDEEHISILLAAYLNDPAILGWKYPQVRQVRDRLLLTRMVRWKEEAGSWEVDEAIRPLLEKYLQQARPETWRRLHCAAYRLYEDWERKSPEERSCWQQEAEYHAGCLRNAGYDPEGCLWNLGQEEA